MPLKTMTAFDAKNSFGVFLDAVRREPVTVTKNGREVAVMFSMEDLRSLAEHSWPSPSNKMWKMALSECLRP